jgi:hypothetical protein
LNTGDRFPTNRQYPSLGGGNPAICSLHGGHRLRKHEIKTPLHQRWMGRHH